jgi:PKD repeat protein
MKIFSFLAIASGVLCLAGCNQKDTPTSNINANFSVSGFENPVPTTINLLNTSTNATSYLWDFGDGTTSTGSNPTHLYTQAGTYQLKLTATGPTGTKSVCKLLTVDAVVPNSSGFSYFIDRCAGAPAGASFKTLNPGSSQFYWNFNGTVNTTRDPVVQFLIPGDYTIKYSTVINGVRDTVTRIIQIQ